MKQYEGLFNQLEEQYGIPAGVLYGLAMVESSGNPLAVSKVKGSTAKGMFQINDPTAKQWKVDPFNVEQSARGTARQLKQAYDTFGDWDKAVLAHQMGIQGVKNGKVDDAYLDRVSNFAATPFGNRTQNGGEAKPPVKGQITNLKNVQEEEVDPTKGMSPYEKFFSGVAAGMESAVQGAKQTGLAGADNAMELLQQVFPDAEWVKNARDWAKKKRETTQADIDENARLNRSLRNTGWGTAGDLTGQIALTAPLPMGGLATAAKGTAALAKGAGMGLINAATGARESDTDPLSFAGQNVVGGATGNLGLYQLGKLYNAVAGKFRKYTTDTGRQDPVKLYQSAKDKDIPVSIGDIDPTSLWHRWENFSANIPLSGRRAQLGKQAEAVAGAVREFDENARPLGMVSGKSGFDDPGQMIFDAIRKEYKDRKSHAETLYDIVNDAAKEKGVQVVQPGQTIKAIQGIEDRFGNMLSSFGDNKLNQSIEGIRAFTSQTAMEKYGPPTFNDMRMLRTLVGEKIREMENRVKAGAAGDSQLGALKGLYKAIEGDISHWATEATQNEEVFQKFIAASDYYKNKIDPYKRTPMLNEIRLLPEGAVYDYDKILSAVAGKDRPNRAELILGQAAPEGQEAAVHHLIRKATEAGLDPNMTGGMSPAAFLRTLDLGRTRDVVFNKTMDDVTDMENVLRATKRASEYTRDPPTGARITPAYVLGAMTGVPMIGALVGSGGGAAAGAGLMAGAIGASRVANKYTMSDIAKRMHLADPRKLPFDKMSYLQQTGSRSLPYLLLDLMADE